MGNNFKAGIFVFLTLLLLGYIIIQVGGHGGSLFGGNYTIYMVVDSAAGIETKTPVQIAGVIIGEVEKIELYEGNKARLRLGIKKNVKVASNARAQIKTMGILGDVYIELYQPGPISTMMPDGGYITEVQTYGDINSLVGKMSTIGDDLKAITEQVRKVMGVEDSAFNRSMLNIEKITDSIARMTDKNEKNINVIVANMKSLSENLNSAVARNMGHIDSTAENIDEITARINRGEGTVGKLLKDDETANKINDSLDNINEFLGGANRLQVDFGAHTEYLGGTGDFKNYVSLALRPRPDKYFLFELVSDPDPSPVDVIKDTFVESGGSTTQFTTRTRTRDLNKFLFSAEFVKRIYDFNIRGGMIESTGGFGLDYSKGPFTAQFSAFDFKKEFDQRPHLKLMGTANVTDNFYLLTGLDDFISNSQDLAWFGGLGFTFTDDDIKSLMGLLSFKK